MEAFWEVFWVEFVPPETHIIRLRYASFGFAQLNRLHTSPSATMARMVNHRHRATQFCTCLAHGKPRSRALWQAAVRCVPLHACPCPFQEHRRGLERRTPPAGSCATLPCMRPFHTTSRSKSRRKPMGFAVPRRWPAAFMELCFTYVAAAQRQQAAGRRPAGGRQAAAQF